jgi:hypothetical protein
MSVRQSPPLVALAALLVLGGCLSAGAGGQSPSPTPTQTATDTPVTTPTDGPGSSPAPTSPTASTPDGHEQAANQPDPDKHVLLANDWNETVTIEVSVVRESTNETVHEGSYDLEPGAERTVYNTSAADPDGIERFTVVVTARGTTERVDIETSQCYGEAYGEVQSDGSLYLYYSIC